MSRSAWDSALQTFVECRDASTGKIDTLKYVEMCDRVSDIYGAMFMSMLASQLKSDIDNSSGNVRKAYDQSPENSQTLDTYMEHLLQTRGHQQLREDRASGVHGLLWSKRSVEFVVTYIEKLCENEEMTGSQCAQATYEQVLMPYHGWITSKFVKTVMGYAPSRETVCAKLGLEADASGLMREFLAVARPIINEVHNVLETHNCNFPDKV